jgi:hypothetical protein
MATLGWSSNGDVRLHSDKRRKILIGAGKVRHANITQDGLSATA